MVIDRLYATLQSRHDHGIDSHVENQSETLCLSRSSSEVKVATSFSFLADSRGMPYVPSIFASTDDDDLLGDDAHQRYWSKQLADEEVLEEEFKVVDHKYETRLWRSMGDDYAGNGGHRRLAQSSVLVNSDGDTDGGINQ